MRETTEVLAKENLDRVARADKISSKDEEETTSWSAERGTSGDENEME